MRISSRPIAPSLPATPEALRPRGARPRVAAPEEPSFGPLLADPLFLQQRTQSRAYGPADYARALTQAVSLSAGEVRMGKKNFFEGIRDLVEAVLTGFGERKLGLSRPEQEVKVLEGVVSRARQLGRPLELGEVLAVALTETRGHLGEAMDLAAAAMQNAVRDTEFYLRYAAEKGISPDTLGLHTAGTNHPQAAGVGFMARYVRDPSGKAYGLLGEPDYATAHNLSGQIYHAIDVMRLTAMNDVLTPESAGRLIELYYSESMRKVNLRGEQGPDKAAQDRAAVAGMRQLLAGAANLDRDQVQKLLAQNQRGRFYQGISRALMSLAEGTIHRLAAWGFKFPKTKFI